MTTPTADRRKAPKPETTSFSPLEVALEEAAAALWRVNYNEHMIALRQQLEKTYAEEAAEDALF